MSREKNFGKRGCNKMVLEFPLPPNAVRDVRYKQIFQDLQRNKALLKQKVDVPQIHWESKIASDIDASARDHDYRFSRKTSLAPDFYVLGYDKNYVKKTISFLEALALQRIFERCSFLAEGYDGQAPLLSRVNAVTNPKLNTVFSQYKITPKGKDSHELRESQYKYLDSQNEGEILTAIDCLVKRERDYFLPVIIEEKKKGKPIIFLADVVHALSSNFPIVLNNNGVRYAILVPNLLK